MSRLALLAAVLALAAPASVARAQGGVFGADTVHGLGELRLGLADGERSWVDGGFGKAGLGGDRRGGWNADLALSQAVVEWRPRFSFALGAVVSAQYQRDADHPLDLDEAYLKLKAPPSALGRLSARAGVFYPPVSQEHGGVGWTTTDLLSASAIDTWIGEEVKVGGLEGTYARDVGGSEIAATGAVFGWNDTSGTLLTFRGWSLGELRSGLTTSYRLPPLSAFMVPRQSDRTDPLWEIDHRAGFYGRLEWRPPAPVVLSAFYYDNRGDLVGVRELQWAWRTRFANLGLRWEPDTDTHVLAQAMSGNTRMGFRTPELWADVDFRSAYLLASRQVGRNRFSGRLDWFDTRDRSYQAIDDNAENGWAATAGWRRELGAHLALYLEAQQLRSKRPSRALAGVASHQDQTVLQSALRVSF